MKANVKKTLDHGDLLVFSSILSHYHSIDFLLSMLYSLYSWMCFVVLSMLVDVDRFISPFCIAEGFFPFTFSRCIEEKSISAAIVSAPCWSWVWHFFFLSSQGVRKRRLFEPLCRCLSSIFTPLEERNKILSFFKKTEPREYSRHSSLYSLSRSFILSHSSFL